MKNNLGIHLSASMLNAIIERKGDDISVAGWVRQLIITELSKPQPSIPFIQENLCKKQTTTSN